MSKDRLNSVTYIRFFAIMSLVAWHCYCSYIAWGIGNSPLDKWYAIAFRFFAPTANMPLFTFLSGYLFCFLLNEKGKYSDFKGFLVNKVNRLLVPYLVLGFVINLTQIGRGKPFLPMFYGAPNHMWYCLILFYCFIICWVFEKKFSSRANMLLAILSFLFVLFAGGVYMSESSPLGIWMLAYFYGYFYVGFIVYHYSDSLYPTLYKYKILLGIAFICFALLSYKFKHLEGISSLIFVMFLTTIAQKIESCPPHWMEIVAKYSFGVYVFHQWIIWNVTRYEPMQPLIREHYVLFPIVLFICVFSISMLLTHLSIKTRVGRYLLT